MPIKSFRGQIADGAVDIVNLHTRDGSVGYRILKMDLIGVAPGATGQESVVKIYKIPQTVASVDGVVDFNDTTLAAAGFLRSPQSIGAAAGFDSTEMIVFDNEIFNQDIFITHHEDLGSSGVNYYLELEQIKLDLNENTVATLKNIRNIDQSSS
tara:strand:- start:826 stop:1287 length:462 start_codon:yes stop_codon:yes gene_type:complete